MSGEGLSGRESYAGEAAAPAVESLFNLKSTASNWPDVVKNDPAIEAAVEERKALLGTIDAVYATLPKSETELMAAVESGTVTEDRAAELYNGLSDLFQKGESSRLVLYLPYELLPRGDSKPATKELEEAAAQFTEQYKKAWQELLVVHDVRANFVDGDVLPVSERAGDLPRIVKAAHLAPQLVSRGILTSREIVELATTTTDVILRESLAEALVVIEDLKLLTDEDRAMLANAKDPLFDAVPEVAQPAQAPRSFSKDSFTTDLKAGLSAIYAEDWGRVTPARRAWLVEEKRREVIEMAAASIETAVQSQINPQELIELAVGEAAELAVIHGIRVALEALAKSDLEKARASYEAYRPVVSSVWDHKTGVTEETLASFYHRLGTLGVVSESELAARGIAFPRLSGPFLDNAEELIAEHASIAEAIQSNVELAKAVYPAAVLFGSRLKGYGGKEADVDVGVFVRPGTPATEVASMREALKEVLSHEKIGGKAVEFWLEESGGNLRVKTKESDDARMGEASWTHVLFGAAWSGDKAAIKELHEKLLTPYLNVAKTVEEKEHRRIWLEELERDALQYRLMHKGYARFYPERGGIHTPHVDRIDGDSVFWDSGYRRLATRLFVSRVFLPEQSENK